MHSGVQAYRTHEGVVIPAYAGIQGMPRGGIPAPVSSPVPYLIRERDKLRGDDGQYDVPSLHPWRENRDQNA